MKKKKIPVRQCVGCMEAKPKKELIRIVINKDKEIKIDTTGKASGRGVYLCKNGNCFELARKKKALSRSLKTDIPKETLDRIFEELKSYETKDS